MARMRRNAEDRPVKKNGDLSRHRRIDPPRTEDWSFWTTRERFNHIDNLVDAVGARCRADALDEAVPLLLGLLRHAPLPAWVAITELDTGATTEERL